MEYLERILLEDIKKWIDRKEILAVKGPRQSGKTTLLKMLKGWLIEEKRVKEKNIIYVTFEDRELLEKFDTNPKDFIKKFVENENEKYYFLIDEAHYSKELGQKLKLLYDTFENIKFIITGSSSMEIMSTTSKFLVGRVFSFELLPFNFYEFLNTKNKSLLKIYFEKNNLIKNLVLKEKDFEIPKNDIFLKDIQSYFNEFLKFGGYPEVVKVKSEDEKKIILKNIFNTYLERDIISFLQITDTIKFRKLVASLSSLIGNLISYETLSNTCGTYYKDIVKLLDILEQTYIIRFIRPFYKNLVTELRKNPKIYFLDCGLRNYSINNFNDLEIRSDAGKLVENFVMNEINFMFDEFLHNFWRTTAKAEVDFILSDVKGVIPIEVKFESLKREKIPKSLVSFIHNYSPKYAIVLTKDFWGEKKIKKTVVKFIPVVYF